MNIFKKNSIRAVRQNLQKGFTILELLIVIAIMAILTTIILFNSHGLNSSVLVSNTAYEIGLMVREAQVYGLGVRATENTTTGFTYSQGIHLDISKPNQITLFSDKDGNGQWSGATEDIQMYTISKDRAGQILSLCVVTDGSCTVVSTADILFKRPNPEAFFVTSPASAGSSVVANLGFTPGNGQCRSIIIQKSGAIQIDRTYCPS
ncbi:MAG: hypothetical protein RJB39_626 [Candidatus Parcubacteria bacterium]|jgi:prepilin-type N-terminal cleavage/methylation domain-containing protein